ncbi:hypothetical protein LJC18_04480 [Lachnospiraceae bacterium OttesenSCG-928-E19]|nr:hypothetical protein [Lachnospiraceae bacterium OttesenSCG-928-E19]
MHRITISIISIFAVFPAFANARLPVVNVGAGSVSARAAFGEVAPKNIAQAKPTPLVEVAPVQKSRAVVSRAASVDAGEKIAHVKSDVLMPKRPSSDLWARNEKPLRLPEPSEFAVIRSDAMLPEEDLDVTPKIVARTVVAAPQTADFGIGHTNELDAEIAKLVELQRRADESIRIAAAYVEPTPAPRPSVISSYDVKPAPVARAAIRTTEPIATPAPVQTARVAAQQPEPEIAVRRVVVPIQDDVVLREVKKSEQPKFASMESNDMSKMSPGELKKAFKKTYLSENKHLSTYRIDDRFDVASEPATSIEGFTAVRDLSEIGGVRPLEIKIGFRNEDSALSRDNYNLLSEYAGIVVSNPKRAIQISIPERVTQSLDGRKLAARRLAIVEQVLKDTGVSDQRIMPVLSQRNDDNFVLRVISNDQFQTMSQQKRDMFGDTTSKKTYKSMSW